MTDGEVVYFSRTKQRLWKKGETSGHVQVIHDVKLDCDNDALVYSVEQVGGAACHTGRVSCFFQSPQPDGSWLASGAKIFNPDEVYSSSNTEKH
jgi:phosphoribosyl-AMP cyclohydrolase